MSLVISGYGSSHAGSHMGMGTVLAGGAAAAAAAYGANKISHGQGGHGALGGYGHSGQGGHGALGGYGNGGYGYGYGGHGKFKKWK